MVKIEVEASGARAASETKAKIFRVHDGSPANGIGMRRNVGVVVVRGEP